jgi:transposase-like protein
MSPTATKTQRFTCPECGETFKAARALSSHRHYKHGIQSTPRSRRYLESSDSRQALQTVDALVNEVKRLLAVEEDYKRLQEEVKRLSEAVAGWNPKLAKAIKTSI